MGTISSTQFLFVKEIKLSSFILHLPGVFAAMMSLRYGYRVVGIAGSFVASGGLLLASLIPDDTIEYRNLIAFLVSCVSGMKYHLINLYNIYICLYTYMMNVE